MCTLTNLEKETIIIFSEAEETARIETFNGRLLRKLRSAVLKTGKVTCEEDQNDYGVYIIPKSMITIYIPAQLTDEQRAKKSALGKALRAKQLQSRQNQF